MNSKLAKIKESFLSCWGNFRQALDFVAVNRRLVVYAAFFALAGGVLNLIKSIPAYTKYLEFYNPFWTGLDFGKILSLKNWLMAVWESLTSALSFGSLAGDIVYLSSANLISIGVLVAALFFSAPLKEFFRQNDFAWQAAFYSFGSSMLFLPFFWFFSKVIRVDFLAGLFMVAESLALSIFLAILLTFFEAVFLYSIKFRLGQKAHTRAEIFAAATAVFRPLFLFNLLWMFLNPINFSGLFSVPALLSFLPGVHVQSSIFNFLVKALTSAFLLFSLAFVFVPVMLIFKPLLAVAQAMKDSLSIFKIRPVDTFFFLLLGLFLQVAANFLLGFLSKAMFIFGAGTFIEQLFRAVAGPFFYAFGLLVFAAAMIRFLTDFYGKELAATKEASPEVQVPSRFLPQAQGQGIPLEKGLGGD